MRVCYFTQRCESYLRKYLNGRGNDDVPALFRSYCLGGIGEILRAPNDRHRLSRRAIERITKKLFVKVFKNGKRIHVHSLRHYFATVLHNNGVDLLDLSHLMGHRSVSTTQRYIHSGSERLRNVYNAKYLYA